LYNCLIKLIEHRDTAIRGQVLICLLSIRANHTYKLQIDDVTSPYLRCHSLNLIRTISFVLPLANLIDALLERISLETDYEILTQIVRGTKDILNNFFLLKDPPVWRVCSVLCAQLKQRFEFIIGDDLSINNIDKGTTTRGHTGCCQHFIHALKTTAGYAEVLSHVQRQALVQVLVFVFSKLISEEYPNQDLLVSIMFNIC
jgi:hypothetical protein